MFLAAIAFAARGELTGERPAGLSQLASLGVYALMVLVILGVLMFLTTWLGGRRPSPEKDMPYESGVIPTGSRAPEAPGAVLPGRHILHHIRP